MAPWSRTDMRTLIKDGTVVTASDTFAADVWIEGGKIAALADPATRKAMGVADTSFKLFMAYPGVLLLDDQSIFRAMLRAGELGALICMHAEHGLPIDVLVQRAIAEGKRAPVWHALTRPEVAEATGTERAM